MFAYFKELLTSKKLYISITLLAAGGILMLLLLDNLIMPAYTNYDEGLTVPNVTELSLEEAEELLTSYGLRFEVSQRRSNKAFPANYVIDQTPAAPEIVKPNRKIYLTVNTATTITVEVPKLVELSLTNAKVQLENYGLRIGTVSYQSARFKNSVMRQSIEPGKVVEEGTAINLTVSDGLGEKIVKVPGIIGAGLSEAQRKLHEAGIKVGEIRFQPNKQYPPNTILDYEPKKEEIRERDTLKLIVSERYEVKEESESAAIQVDTTYVAEPDSSNQQ